ncbi:Proteinase-activated receptor 1 like [Senna tora]|uniref:Proteinase-activated receptor 1 like n=1 Tax=Senna tora TaxID=362788 RepID=A0A834WIL2_9FABA|nr:Proteinase-activated receptor 1 like [Senna tora]
MASLLTQSLTFTLPARASFTPPSFSISPPAIRFSGDSFRRRKLRGSTVVTRAGPSSSSYIFAFALPFSLLAITIFASLRIGERLDREFLEEMAMNEAIMETEEDDEDDIETYIQEEPALTRARNRPKREA